MKERKRVQRNIFLKSIIEYLHPLLYPCYTIFISTGYADYRIDKMIQGDRIGDAVYSESASDCHKICIVNNDCDCWNFEFIYFSKGSSWSLSGYGKCQIGQNISAEMTEEHFIAGLKSSCSDSHIYVEKLYINNILVLLLAAVLVQTMLLMLNAMIVTTLFWKRYL